MTALGYRMTVAAHRAVQQHGGSAYLMMRPETIALSPVTEGGMGTVLRTTFHGHSVDYEVETAVGTLSVTEPGPDPGRLLAEGTNVTVTIDPARSYVLSQEWSGTDR